MFAICTSAVWILAACSGKSGLEDSAVAQSSDDGGDDGGDDAGDDGGDNGGDDGGSADDDGTDGAVECEVALDCAYACDPDEACALECGGVGLDSARQAAFEVLVTCMVDAGCGITEECLDAECEAEFQAFDELCT